MEQITSFATDKLALVKTLMQLLSAEENNFEKHV